MNAGWPKLQTRLHQSTTIKNSTKRKGVFLCRQQYGKTIKTLQMSASSNKTPLDFLTIARRFDTITLPKVDAVIGILNGGMAPALMCADRLKCPLFVIEIHFRDADNQPEFPEPRVISNTESLPAAESRVLLVDDVSVTGSTFQTARALLKDRQYKIQSLVLKGKGDFVLFPEISGCVHWPWHP